MKTDNRISKVRIDAQAERMAVVRIRGPVAEALGALIDSGAVFGSLVRGTYPHPVTDVVLTVGVLSPEMAKKVKKLLAADAPSQPAAAEKRAPRAVELSSVA